MVETTTDIRPVTQHIMNLEKFPLVEITRTFAAPIESVWKAWSEPELLKEWWGPVGYSSPSVSIDFKLRGKFLYAMEGPDKKVIWGTGEYLEIIPNKKIVSTDQFCDQNGKILSPSEVSMPGEWPEKLYITIEFEGLDAHLTKMRLTHEGIPKEVHDDCVQGWSQSFDKLQKLVERH